MVSETRCQTGGVRRIVSDVWGQTCGVSGVVSDVGWGVAEDPVRGNRRQGAHHKGIGEPSSV
ncbi:MAG: hypothetical protein LBL06_00720 [Treponema sp.]|nr:hypothetical protein [Treponema sp.]